MKRPRGLCPQCGEEKAVTSQGRMWAHDVLVSNAFGVVRKDMCPGTGCRPLAQKGGLR